MQSNRIVEATGGLQIDLRRTACQDRFAAQNDAVRVHARGEFRKPDRRGAITKTVIGAWGWRAESIRIHELKSTPRILIGLPPLGR